MKCLNRFCGTRARAYLLAFAVSEADDGSGFNRTGFKKSRFLPVSSNSQNLMPEGHVSKHIALDFRSAAIPTL